MWRVQIIGALLNRSGGGRWETLQKINYSLRMKLCSSAQLWSLAELGIATSNFSAGIYRAGFLSLDGFEELLVLERVSAYLQFSSCRPPTSLVETTAPG